jgi:hypothetical protein
MKNHGVSTAIALFLLPVAYGQGTSPMATTSAVRASTRLQMLASVEQAVVKAGEPVKMHFHYRNVSSKDVWLADNGWEQDYELIITNASGVEAALTDRGNRWRQLGVTIEMRLLSAEGPRRVSPGEEGQEVVLDLTKFYQLTQPGTYSARIICRSLRPDPDELAKPDTKFVEKGISNLVQFTIAR